MNRDEHKLFRTIDVVFYLVFVPVVLMLIPLERFWTRDPYFFAIIMAYAVVVHYTNRRFSSFDAILNKDYLRAAIYFGITMLATYLVSIINVRDLRDALGGGPSIAVVKNMRIRSVYLIYVIDISFNVMLGLTRELSRQRIRAQQIIDQKNKAELAMYKSQINPHFMFNTLNTLYGLFISNSDKTEDVFIKFTDMIKYMYSNAQKESISIVEEVKYLKEFIDLHTLRLGEQTKVRFDSQIDDLTAQLPPVLLITFVENAFKYGVSSTCDSEIIVNVTLSKGELNFTTENSIFVRQENNSSGIGIQNSRKRLDLLYGDRYTLDCNAQGNKFTTKLKVYL